MCFYISVFVDVPSYVPMNLCFTTSFIHFDVFIFLISDIFENCQCEDALFPERGVMLYFWGIPLLDVNCIIGYHTLALYLHRSSYSYLGSRIHVNS